MAFMLNSSPTTVSRIFKAWIISTIYYLQPHRFDKKSWVYAKNVIPEAFVKTGHGTTDLIIDTTEFKFQSSSNYELSSLMFSNYKNTTYYRQGLVWLELLRMARV